MPNIELPFALVDLQRTADQAWAALETHRKQVDDRRRQDTPDIPGRPAWTARPMRPWTDEEDAEHLRLRAAAIAAQEAVRSGFAEAGLSPQAAVVRALKRAAAEEQPTA